MICHLPTIRESLRRPRGCAQLRHSPIQSSPPASYDSPPFQKSIYRVNIYIHSMPRSITRERICCLVRANYRIYPWPLASLRHRELLHKDPVPAGVGFRSSGDSTGQLRNDRGFLRGESGTRILNSGRCRIRYRFRWEGIEAAMSVS